MKTAGKGCLVIIIVVIALTVLGAIVGNKSTNTKTTSTNPDIKSETLPSVVPTEMTYTKVTAKQIIEDYDKNKLSAEDKYKNKPVEFEAKVKNISTDIVGAPYLSLEPANADQYYFGTTLTCTFKTADELKTLENGNTYTMHGVIEGMLLGIVVVKDCAMVK